MTIYALSSGPGISGISVVRVNGARVEILGMFCYDFCLFCLLELPCVGLPC